VPCYIAKNDSYFAHGKTLKAAVAALHEKTMATLNLSEKIAEFKKKFQKGVKYPATEFYKWHGIITGSCEIGRSNFVREKNIDLEKDKITPEKFFELTANEYGSESLRKLKEVYCT
jgi:hypothetical protein